MQTAHKTIALKQVPRSPAVGDGRYDHLVRADGKVHRTLFTDPEIF